MVDYNDGKWHAWNGGQRPVHEESVVEVKYLKGGDIYGFSEWVTGHTDKAGWFDNKSWIGVDDSENNPIVAFRVVKEYIEPPKPREWFALVNMLDDIVEIAPSVDELDQHMDDVECIVVREVL